MAFVGKRGWFTSGYIERNPFNFGYINDQEPTHPRVVNPSNPNITPGNLTSPYFNQNLSLIDVASDGKWIYVAQAGHFVAPSSYVTAFDVTADDPHQAVPAVFGSGTTLTETTCSIFPQGNCGANPNGVSWVNTSLSVIDVEATISKVGSNYVTPQRPPTGIAVQRDGNVLAVAHGDYRANGTSYSPNEIRLFDKRSGNQLGSTITTIANPTQMAFTSRGLWAVSGGKLYLISDVGGANTLSQPIQGLVYPVSVASNRMTNHLFVLDGGSSQQLKEFDADDMLVSTYGVAGVSGL